MLFFDIETLPATKEQYPDLKVIFERKKEKDASFGRENNETFEEFVHSSGMHGSFGHLLCVGYAIDNEPANIISGNEIDQLSQFWKLVKENKLIIGHNILGFDIPFLKHRSIVLGVKNNFIIPKPWDKFAVFDTMKEWEFGNRERGWNSLDAVSRALGLQSSKGELDGSKVAQYYEDGKLDEIYNYCKADVEVTRKVYKKLIFADTNYI